MARYPAMLKVDGDFSIRPGTPAEDADALLKPFSYRKMRRIEKVYLPLDKGVVSYSWGIMLPKNKGEFSIYTEQWGNLGYINTSQIENPKDCHHITVYPDFTDDNLYIPKHELINMVIDAMQRKVLEDMKFEFTN